MDNLPNSKSNIAYLAVTNKATLQEILNTVDKLPLDASASNYAKVDLLHKIGALCNDFQDAEKFIAAYIDDVPVETEQR